MFRSTWISLKNTVKPVLGLQAAGSRSYTPREGAASSVPGGPSNSLTPKGGRALDRKEWEPIPLTPFELMMLLDDQPGYHKNCAAQFSFDGAIDRDAFTLAYRRTIDRHKLSHGLVATIDGRRCWVPTQMLPLLYWNHSGAKEAFAVARPFDLTREPGVRTWVNVDGDQSVVRVDFHHACCDAAGGMSIIEDVLVQYDAIIRNETPTLREFDDERLMLRDKVEIPHASLSAWVYRSFVDLKKSLRLFFTRALPIPYARQSTAHGHPEPANCRFVTRTMSEEDLVALRHVASDQGVTLNDLVLVEFMCALRDWIETGNQGRTLSDRDHVCVIVPMNLRDRQDMRLSSANKMGFSFLSRSLRELASADSDRRSSALASVHAELKESRQLILPAQFLQKLAWLHRIPIWFDYWFAKERCWATAILTQIGDPTRRFRTRFARKNGRIVVGDLTLSRIASCGPLRPQSHGLLSINTYGNTMTLTFCWDPATIDRSAAEAFLDCVVERLGKQLTVAEPDAVTRRQ